jgi:hypothetical protein
MYLLIYSMGVALSPGTVVAGILKVVAFRPCT